MRVSQLLRAAALATPLFFTSCQESLLSSAAKPSAPVSFRLVNATGDTLPRTSLVQFRAWINDLAKPDSTRLDSVRMPWDSGQVTFDAPYNKPLRFQLDGLKRAINRDYLVWTATGNDTLREGSRNKNVVTLGWKPLNIAAPNVHAFAASGATLQIDSVKHTLTILLSTGSGKTTLTLPPSVADSLLRSGLPLSKDPLTGFSLSVKRGDTATVTLIGSNRVASEWSLSVLSSDMTPPSFDIQLNGGASRRKVNDTILFTLPYVIASPLQLTIANSDSNDQLQSIAFDGSSLSRYEPQWTIPVKIPAAGTSTEGSLFKLASSDSLGNTDTRFIKIVRPYPVGQPFLTWLPPPVSQSFGARADTLFLQVTNGDSGTSALFTLAEFRQRTPGVKKISQRADTTLWRCIVSLDSLDSGTVSVSATNASGTKNSLDTVRIGRFDPLGEDKFAPILSVVSPADGAWVGNATTTTLHGTARDERTGMVTVQVTHGGRTDTATWDAQEKTWGIIQTWTSDGDSALTIQAIDAQGNKSPALPWLLRRDTRKPSLAWGGSQNDAIVTSLTKLPLSFAAIDSVTFYKTRTVRSVVVLRDIAKPDTLEANKELSGLWAVDVDLTGLQGTSQWIAIATDSAGNQTTKTFAITSGDLTPPSLSLAMNNDAVATAQDDTTVYTLPYGITAPLALTITNDTPKDILKTANLGATPLDLTKSSWTVSLPVPVDGDKGTTYTLTATDSVKNSLTKVIKVVRPFYAQAPQLRWVTPPNKRALGAGLDSLQLSIKNGDSAITPKFDLTGFTQEKAAFTKLWQDADSSLWLCVVTLGEKDSGTIAVKATNRSGLFDSLDPLRLSRFDPRDGAIPSIFVSQRTNTWVASNTMTLSGKAFSWQGKSVKVIATGGAWADSIHTGTDSTWKLTVPLTTEGDVFLNVFARDSVGKESTPAKLIIKHDSKKPGLAITKPGANDTLRTNLRSMPFGVTSTDSLGVKSIQVWREGAGASDTIPLVQDAGTASAWATTITSPQGWSRWIVRAVDSAGNDSLRSLVILSDTIKPTLTWAMAGNIPAGRYALNAAKDTLWLASDTTVTISVNTATGFAGVGMKDATADSLVIKRTVTGPLTLSQATGTSTVWTFAVSDSLGNASTPVKLTVVGLAPVTAPLVLFGKSDVAATPNEILPWPKTAHMTCPTGTTLNIGTSASKDSVIWTATNLSLSCIGSKIRSKVENYSWTIQDTASIELKEIPTIDSLLAVAVDENDMPWVFGNYGGYHRIHKFSTDTTVWHTAFNAFSEDKVKQVFRAAGSDVSKKRYFGYNSTNPNTGKKEILWLAVNGPWNDWLATPCSSSYWNDGNPTLGNAIRGTSFYQAITGPIAGFSVTRTALSTPTKVLNTYNVSSSPKTNSPKMQIAVTKDSILTLWSIDGGRSGSYQMIGSMNAGTGIDHFKIDATYQRTSISGRMQDNTFIVSAAASNKLVVLKYSDPRNSNPIASNYAAGTLSLSGTPLNPEFGKSDLWINASGDGIFRIEDDISKVRFWKIPGVQKSPSLNQWDGAWSLVKNGSSYRLYHFKGSKQ